MIFKKALYIVGIFFCVFATSVSIYKYKDYQFIKYINEESTINEIASLSFAVYKYERIFYTKPKFNKKFEKFISGLYSVDDPFYYPSNNYKQLDLEFRNSNSHFLICSDKFCKDNCSDGNMIYYKSLNFWNSFVFNGIVILDSMPINNVDLYKDPPKELFLIKDGLPFVSKITQDSLSRELYNSSLEIINNGVINNIPQNRFKAILSNTKPTLKILADEDHIIINNEEVIETVYKTIFENMSLLGDYSEVYFSLPRIKKKLPDNL